MKLKHKTLLPKKLIRKKKHGFALIASLTLMMLLTLLAVGVLAIASSQNRIAMQTALQAEARQQALVGLDAALAELQITLGPDRRVTASSAIVSQEEGAVAQHILGVWDSWSGPIYGRAVADGQPSSIKDTYEPGRASMFRRWLISSRRPSELTDVNAVNTLGSRDPGNRICMVGEGTLGRRFTGRHLVYADLISMPSSGKNSACYAWWIGGENQKSKITVRDPEQNDNPMSVLRRTWNTPSPMFLDCDYLSFLPERIENPDKLLTMASIPLVANSSQDAGMPYFFDVTTTSYSLPINVRTGGFKQDLCLLLSRESLRGTEFAARSNQDCPIAEGRDVPQGTESNMPIGSWQNLHAFYNCWPDGSANDSDNFTARLIGNVDECYTRMSGTAYPHGSPENMASNPDSLNPGANGTVYDSRAMLEQGSKSAGYARTPVMLAFMNTFGLVTEENPGVTTSDQDQCYKLYMCFAPMFLWWNPYNVPMKIRGRQLWAQSAPYKATWLQTQAIKQSGTWNYGWSHYAMQQSTGDTGFGQDYGDYFQASLNSETSDIEFAPGEILFFSPGQARATDTYTKPYSNPWTVGYNASSVSGYRARFYTMSAGKADQPGVASRTNLDNGEFYVGLRLGQYAGFGGLNTDGLWFAPKNPEAITVFNGYNGMAEASGADGGAGKRGQSPHRGLLGWYDPSNTDQSTVFCDPDRNDARWSADGSQSDSTVPYFVAALGIVPKSANRNLDSRILEGQDFRTKSWQHSSPAFWGSMIINPDDQQRQYHPYQLAALDVGAGMNACPMDSVGNNGMLGITSDGEQVSFVSVLELPVHPPFSLAGFAGMRLQPGWYNANASGDYVSQSALRRMQYQSGVPGVGIGNSFADPCMAPDEVYAQHQTNIFSQTGGNEKIFGDFFDHGLLINDALWDRWFCSSISDMPNGRNKMQARQVLEDFLSGKEALPVSRYVRSNTPYRDEDIVKRIMDNDGWMYIAQYLMIDGGFNVNSTSVEAWASVLQGLARRQLVTNASGDLALVEPGKNDSEVLFSRFMVSTSSQSIDALGGYSMMQGSTELRNGGMAAAWGDVRKLDSGKIRELAEQIVRQVKLRGPFLSMSDFINRRLDSSDKKLALTGALQAAIDATDINSMFMDETTSPATGGSLYRFREAEEGSIYTAAPGYLIQSDVLASLGNILTVRDDTFTVRAYGCVRNARKAILAQAWCEAVVQRTMEYVDPTNDPSVREFEPDGRKARGLTAANTVFGRRFRIVSFKWLDAWDI
ncbi:MAG: hypothetical protein IKJ58_08965 [Akkermansia sp.]|nr:hypothetical protein [Akkermansia sp.]